MKILLSIAALLNGVYMLIDGIFVILNGKYIGPEKPGPWANVFYKFEINVFKLGTLFISIGLIWILFIIGLWTNQSWTFTLGIAISILTLWYLPLGTLLSILILILLVTGKQKLGF